MKIYVVITPNLEYNDEIYYQQGFEATETAYASKELADKACRDHVLHMLHSYESLGSFAYDWNEVCTGQAKSGPSKFRAAGFDIPDGADLDNFSTKDINEGNLDAFLSVATELPVAHVHEIEVEGSAHDFAATVAIEERKKTKKR